MKHTLLRLVCCVKGHKPFPTRDVPETPPEEPKLFTLGTITGSITGTGGLYFNGSGWSSGPDLGIDSNGVNFIAGPVKATARICSRCHSVYWNSSYRGEYFLSTKALPELDTYMKWQDRQGWETKQRAKNELADKLYNQYQVALKLGYIPESDDDAA